MPRREAGRDNPSIEDLARSLREDCARVRADLAESVAMTRDSVEELNTEQPRTAEELADTLARASDQQKTIELGGNFTKRSGAGPVEPVDLTVSTSRLNRL